MWRHPLLFPSGTSTLLFPIGDSADHNALRPVVAKYLGKSWSESTKPFAGTPALRPLSLHLYWGRWPGGVSGRRRQVPTASKDQLGLVVGKAPRSVLLVQTHLCSSCVYDRGITLRPQTSRLYPQCIPLESWDKDVSWLPGGTLPVSGNPGYF